MADETTVIDTETVETPVDTSTPDTAAPAKTSADVFREARQQIAAQSKDQGGGDQPDSETDNAPASEPSEEPAKPADQTPESGDPDETLLSADEVKKLNPKERSLYEKAQARFTQKTQKIAEERRALAEWTPMIDAFKTNPEDALKRVAAEMGYELTKTGADTTRQASAETLGDLPPELEPLKPALEAYLDSKLKNEIEPIRRHQDYIKAQAAAAETEATLKALEAKHPDWQQFESKMMEFGAKIVPTGQMSELEYLELLYTMATAGRKEAETAKRTVERIQKSAKAAEPQATGVSQERIVQALPPPDQRSLRDAWNAAKEGVSWRE